MDAITDDYYKLRNGEAVDIFFKKSYFMDHFMKQEKGLWERPNGGRKIRIPFSFDYQEGGVFGRGDAVSSDDKDHLNAAYFYMKSYYGNATIYWQDELDNGGEYGQIDLVRSKNKNAQDTIGYKIAGDIYSAAGDTAKTLTGLLSMTSETSTTAYGGVAEDDLVSSDGSKQWEGKTTTTTEPLSLPVIQAMSTSAKLFDGPGGKPDIGLTTETLWNKLSSIMLAMQRLTEDKGTTKAGFTNLIYEGKKIVADDFCPSGYMFLHNSGHVGWAVHKNAYFKPMKWAPLPNDRIGRTMKILFHGNIICDHRRAHIAHSNLS
jgi:hypothetical protein